MSGATTQSERQLIMLSAGTAARRRQRREEIERLLVEVDWPRLAETLRRRRLLTVLGPRIVELSDAQASGEFAAAVARSIEAVRRQSGLLQLVSQRVLETLATHGIRARVLKGPALGEALYGDTGRRLSGDIDLLVSPDDLHAAVDAVRHIGGYRVPADHVLQNGLPLLHFGLRHEQAKLPSVELHWRVHWYERSFAYERLLPRSPDPAGDWRPALADELVALLLFYARDGFVDLRLATDLGAWWDTYGAKLSMGAVDELLLAYRGLARVVPSALKAAERVVGLPPGEVLAKPHELDVRQRIAARLANPNPSSSTAQLYADMGLVDGLLAPAGGLPAFVRRQLLPPAEVLAHQARRGSRTRARSRLTRGAGVLGRYGLRMIRLVRAPEALR